MIPEYNDVVNAAVKLGVIAALLIFVIFVQVLIIFYLLKNLRAKERAQEEVNAKMIDFLIAQKQSHSEKNQLEK